MSPFMWFALSAYLLVAVAVLCEVEFTPPAKTAANQLSLCMFALVYAGSWPLRAVRRILLVGGD